LSQASSQTIPSLSSIPDSYKLEESKSKSKIRYVDAKKAKKFAELGIPIEPSMQDLELTNLLVDADPNTMKYTIPYLLRTKIGNKEYVFGLERKSAKDHS
jgi:hypothetical protein